jgi:diguanylate cyclase (GGDEF)-like protein/PAS domain S-box-containing protein
MEREISAEQILISALMETERRFRVISDEAPSLIWISGPSGRRDFANRAWFDFIGIGSMEASSIDWLNYIHPDDRPHYEAQIAASMETIKGTSVEFRVKKPSGDWSWILERINPRMDRHKCIGLIAAGTDITEIKASETFLTDANERLEREVAERTQELKRLAMVDPLTGLANRRLLLERLEAEIARCDRYEDNISLLFVDVDRFKEVNDTYGHASGDAILIQVANILRSSVRQTDLVSRLGGEEFVVLLIMAGELDAYRIAETIRKKVHSHAFSEGSLSITVSVGLSTRLPGENGSSLLARADLAMLQAKRDGRNFCRVATKTARPAYLRGAEIDNERQQSSELVE